VPVSKDGILLSVVEYIKAKYIVRMDSIQFKIKRTAKDERDE